MDDNNGNSSGTAAPGGVNIPPVGDRVLTADEVLQYVRNSTRNDETLRETLRRKERIARLLDERRHIKGRVANYEALIKNYEALIKGDKGLLASVEKELETLRPPGARLSDE